MDSYGYLNHFRPLPLLPNQVYRFDPQTGNVRVVADGFHRCNGIAFSANGKLAYMYVHHPLRYTKYLSAECAPCCYSADSGAAGGFLGKNTTDPATVYVSSHTCRSTRADLGTDSDTATNST